MRNLTYTAGRFLTVLTKPLCLYGINNYLSPDTAASVATAFIVTAFSVAFISADPHRRFYQSFFSDQAEKTSLSFYSYLINLVVLVALGCLVVLGFMQRSADSTALAIAGIFYFISEKVADEIFRFKLFERNLSRWGTIALSRSLTQLVSLALLALSLGAQTQAWQIIAVLAGANLLTFAYFIAVLKEPPYRFLRTLNLARAKVMLRLLPRALRLLYVDWILWAMTIVAAGIRYLDRFVVLFVDQSALPIFSLVTMCFSVVPLSVDFFYISRHRRDFLEHKILAQDALKSPRFNSTLLLPTIAAIAATTFILLTASNASAFPLVYAMTIALTSLSLATILLPQQILYWRHCLADIFIMDLSFLVISGFVVLLGRQLNVSVNILLWILAGLSALRLLAYLVRSLQVSRAMRT